MSTPFLRAMNLRLAFGADEALRGADIDVEPGEIVAVTGPSGSGKSTFLQCLAGVLVPDSGSVLYEGRRIDLASDAERAQLRRRDFGFVFQFGTLVPELPAVENVMLPLLFSGGKRRHARERALDWLEQLGVRRSADKRPRDLSGGELQRVAVARALVTDPAVVFADEPTGALDSLAGELVMELLVSLARTRGTTVVVVTHDPRVAAYAARELELRDGRIHGSGVLL
jgi:putative ABC transport system ATP-binding protein